MSDNQDKSKPTPKVGDWIRFYNGGRIVIGVVQYVSKQRHFPWEDEASTDLCPVAFSQILEIRGA